LGQVASRRMRGWAAGRLTSLETCWKFDYPMRSGLPPLSKWVFVCAFCSFHLFAIAAPSALTFDEMPPVDSRMIENGYGGLQWSNFFIQNATNFAAGFYPGMVSSPDVAFNGSGNDASFSSSNAFTLGSAYLSAVYVSGMEARVKGFSGTNVLYDNTYAISGGAPNLISFNYVDVDKVTFASPSS
jgi:hypothetical protein